MYTWNEPSPRLQWGHGGEAVETPIRWYVQRPSNGFNGATAVKPWRLYLLLRFLMQTQELQWGHGGEAVETMSSRTPLMACVRLQWGHGGEAVETSGSRPRGGTSTCFNGATAVKPWRLRPT